MGGDTDTNAAILGGVIGAGYGFKNFSNKGTEMLKTVIVNSNNRNDGRRGLYSPGIILFTINEIYNQR